MKLYINDRLLSMIFEEDREEISIKSRFTYQDTSQCFTGTGFDSSKIKDVCFIRKYKEYHFMFSGFLYELLLFCKKENINISQIEDKRTKLNHQEKKYAEDYLSKYFPFDYNDHQIKALNKMLKVNNGIIKMSTGGGKGDIITAFMKEVRLPTLVLVDKITLCDQLAERAEEAGISSVGIRHSKMKTQGDFMFSTIGSVKGLPSLERYKVLIIDEVHKSSSNRFQEFLKNTEFPLKFGFSATPNKGDKYIWATIRQFLGHIIYEVPADILIKAGVIAKPKIKFIEVFCPQTMDWQTSYEKAIINNKERNKKIAEVIKKHNEKTLVLIKDVKHGQGEIIKETIEEETDKTVEFIHGSSSNRNEIIKEFDFGDIDVLISTNILNEGVNIKNIRILINASAGKSKVENLQKIGRGTRVTEEKKEVLVYDFYDTGNSFTERHSQIREKLYRKEGFTDIEFI